MTERILDIGIGQGGGYINRDGSSVMRIGLDISQDDLWVARYDYPQIEAIVGSAHEIPLADESIDAIEIRLPQITHPLGYRGVVTVEDSDGWYPEFARVLRSRGKLTMWTDSWFEPERIEQISDRYFETVSIEPFIIDDYMEGY